MSIDASPPEKSGSARPNRTRAEKRRRKRIIIGSAIVVALVATTTVVIVAAVNGGRSGTLTTGGISVGSFDPVSAMYGNEVHLVGSGFTDATDVQFNGVSSNSYNVISDTEISAMVPEGAVSGPITVVNANGSAASGTAFTGTSPYIASFAPNSAAAGSTITITGVNLAATTSVSFNGKLATPTAATDTSVVVTVPNNATSGPLGVINPDTSDQSTTSLTITSPAITMVDPGNAPEGATVTLTGSNLAGTTAVTFNGINAAVTASTATTATVTVPAGATNGPIALTNTNGSTTTDDPFGVGPTVTAISPSSGPVGTVVTITGRNFNNITNVTFTGSAAFTGNYNVVSPTTITVIVPDDANTGPISITGNGSTTTGTYTVTGLVTGVSPSNAAVGATVAVIGIGLTGTTAVSFNGVNGTGLKVISDTEVDVVVPKAATSGAVKVTTPSGVVSAPDLFTIAANPAVVDPFDRTISTTVPYTPASGMPADGAALVTSTTANFGGIALSVLTGTATGGVYAGTATAAIGKIAFAVKVSYTNPSTWTLTPATTATIKAFVGTTAVTVSALTGNISAAAGNITWNVKGTTAAFTPIATKLSFDASATASLQPDCPAQFKSALCATRNGPFLQLDALGGTGKGLTAVLGNIVGTQTGVMYQGAIDLVSGDVNIDGVAPSTSWGLLRNTHIRIAYGERTWVKLTGDVDLPTGTANGGLDFGAFGDGQVDVPNVGRLGFGSIGVAYLDGGTFLEGTLKKIKVFGDADMTNMAIVVGHGSPVNVTVFGAPKQLVDSTWFFTGSMSTPYFVRHYLGMPSSTKVGAYVQMETNGAFEVAAVYQQDVVLPKAPHFDFAFHSFSLSYRSSESNPTAGSDYIVSANGTGSIDSGTPFVVQLQAIVTRAPESTSFTVGLTAAGANGKALWPDILGVNGFDLTQFSLQIGITSVAPYATFGLAGTGNLPPKLMEYLGSNTGAPVPVNFVVNISETSPCIQASMGTPGGGTVMSLPAGVGLVNINYLNVSASARGCTVGAYTVPAGVTVAEKADMFGEKKDIFIAFNPNKTGPTKGTKSESFYGWFNDRLKSTATGIKWNVRVKWGAGGWSPMSYFDVDGYVTLGSLAKVAVNGGCTIVLGVPSCSITGNGSVKIADAFSANLDISALGLGTPVVTLHGEGDLNIAGLKVHLAGDFNDNGNAAPVGFDIVGTVDFPGSGLVDKLGVELGARPITILALCKGPSNSIIPVTVPCPKTIIDYYGSLSINGNLKGLFTVLNDTATAFNAPKVGGPNRYSLTTGFDFTQQWVTFGGSTSFSLGSLGTIDAGAHFDLCLQPSCGLLTLKPAVDITIHKAGKDFTFPNLALADTWDFQYTGQTGASFYESGQVGNSTAGLKGTVSGTITLSIDVDTSPVKATFGVAASLSAKAYIGVAGWNSLGSVKVSFDSGTGRACFSDSGFKICVP